MKEGKQCISTDFILKRTTYQKEQEPQKAVLCEQAQTSNLIPKMEKRMLLFREDNSDGL